MRNPIASVWRALRRSWLRRKVARLYAAYHQSMLDDQLEAQENHRLPVSTTRFLRRFNDAVRELRKIDPSTRWKTM